MPKDPLLIRTSLRILHGKAQLFPSDINTIQQALIDLSENLSEMQARLEALEAMVASAPRAKHVAGDARGEPAAPEDLFD